MTVMHPETLLNPSVPNPCQREYDFALIVSGMADADGLSDNVMNALFEAGCDDATPMLRYGLLFIEFSRTAESLDAAFLSAIRDVRKTAEHLGRGAVERIDECDLVSAADIGRRTGRSRQAVSQWIKGQRGPGGFPPPTCHLADDAPLWSWCAVSYWLSQNNLLREEEFHRAEVVEAINNLLELERQRQRRPDLIKQVARELRGEPLDCGCA